MFRCVNGGSPKNDWCFPSFWWYFGQSFRASVPTFTSAGWGCCKTAPYWLVVLTIYMKVNGKDYPILFLENRKCLKPPTSHSIPITSLSISHCPPYLLYIICSAVCSLFRVSISYLSTNHKSVWMCCKYAQRYNCIKPFSYPQTYDVQSWSVHDAWFRLMPQSLLWTFSVPNATGKHIPTPWPVADSPKNSVIPFSWLTVPQWNRPGV